MAGYGLFEGDELETTLREFGDYLVGMGALVRADKGEWFADFSSGLILEIRKHWYWTTAGHVITAIERRMKGGQSVSRFHLIDCYGTGKDTNAIPFDYHGAWKFRVDDDDSGLDFGVVELPTNVRALLQANNAKAVNKWTEHTIKFSSYLMLGLPEDDVEREVHRVPVGIKVRGRAIPSAVHITNRRFPKGGKRPHDRFVGRVGDEKDIGDIKGMSGCPIFG